jgi:hypothetical protein
VIGKGVSLVIVQDITIASTQGMGIFLLEFVNPMRAIESAFIPFFLTGFLWQMSIFAFMVELITLVIRKSVFQTEGASHGF